ncbi:hypothetical protein AVEN_7522-1 [Araneus ventricosus]|uniref:Gustatory receptor n=1 Tax=Araneus ventricosus TaxID=182803 RepID=A0A4Y2BCA9_ARAVE|nr:hypothetical protein AVEN_264580-1 [Araneus ventricosus]GBL89678.1 hypothetical protein AVEN_7522-1 [Araneus ventricosus]
MGTESRDLVKAKEKKAEMAFKALFLLFCASGITKTSTSSSNILNQRIKATTMRTFNILVLLSLLIVNISTFVAKNKDILATTSTYIFLVSLLQRSTLSAHLKYFQNILIRLKYVSKIYKLSSTDSSNKWIYLWASAGILLYVILGICNYFSTYEQQQYLLFNYTISQPQCKILLVMFLDIANILYVLLPFHTFAVYYTLLCHQMYCLVKNLQKRLESQQSFQFIQALETFKVLRKLIQDIDTQLSFSMFLSTLFNACVMHYGVNSLIRPMEICFRSHYAAVWLLFGISYSAFIAMTVTGILVHESSERVLEEFKDLACKTDRLIPSQKRILFNDKNQISFTVWKIIPIPISFLICPLGTVLTYCMLSNGMRAERQPMC